MISIDQSAMLFVSERLALYASAVDACDLDGLVGALEGVTVRFKGQGPFDGDDVAAFYASAFAAADGNPTLHMPGPSSLTRCEGGFLFRASYLRVGTGDGTPQLEGAGSYLGSIAAIPDGWRWQSLEVVAL